MIKQFSFSICLPVLLFFILSSGIHQVLAQNQVETIKGQVLESGTSLPLKQVLISVSSTGKSEETDDQGNFSMEVPDLNTELIMTLPGYDTRRIFLHGRTSISISMVQSANKSIDDQIITPLGSIALRDATNAVISLSASDIAMTSSSSFDQAFQGLVPGMLTTQQSGMPGHKTFMNIRGASSLYCKSDPLLIIDGMIHEINYADKSLMDGYSLNPMDIIDIDDIANISILKGGESYLGSNASNGTIFVNTEQKRETSTAINVSIYGGVSLTPKKLELLNTNEFKSYFTGQLEGQGYNSGQIDEMYPWLNGSSSVNEYYRYNNNTDWQNEIYKPSAFQKYHIFLKGGDDIATYNISTGFLKQGGPFDKASYNRFNLRINGKINITNKFSLTPNAKLSLSDSYITNLGADETKNPVLATLLIPSQMAAFAKNNENGQQLNYLDDVGAFNVSNPTSIVTNAVGTSRNYHFLSSINAQYMLTDHLAISNLIGIDFNNARENIFIPDQGLVRIDSASNSPGDFVSEFRSLQNHAMLSYSNKFGNGHLFDGQVGFRFMRNSYKFDKGKDLNTPSDDFKSLGQGSKYNYLRTSIGDYSGLLWISYFGNFIYNFQNKYYLNANLSTDGSSALNSSNRFNIFPSLSAAWRLSSTNFLLQSDWIDELKIRASWSVTGNMHSQIYDYSKLYYTSRRLDNLGVLVREAIPNEGLEIERKTTIGGGLDLSINKQTTNFHIDYFLSGINNLIINQQLPSSFGYTNYYDNGGELKTNGFEFSADTRFQKNSLIWRFGVSVSKYFSEITKLNFFDENNNQIITSVEGAQFVTKVGQAMNSYYGFKTNGTFATEGEAAQITGPKGKPMTAGDIKFVDLDNNNIINEKDKTVIGSPNPDFYGGLSTSVTFKQFEISALINYCLGNDVYNYVRYKMESMDSYSNQSQTVLDRWRPDNTGTDMPKAIFGDPTGNSLFSDRWIEDGSYIRLKQLTVSYNLPKLSGLYKDISIYLTATNLFTFSKYTGYDPEFFYLNDPFYMGIDYGKIPQTRSFILGVKLAL